MHFCKYIFNLMKKLLSFAVFVIISFQAYSNLVLPTIFKSNMVLQQNAIVKIWGWGKSGEIVSIQENWNDRIYNTKVSNNGKWDVEINTPRYGGPYNLIIKGNNTILLSNVLIGEVWVVSGQSNMEWSADSGIDNGELETKNANFPEIRLFSVSHNSAEYPQLNLDGDWKVCNPESMKSFSAIGYFFAKHMYENTKVPIGIINSSWGGTPAEAWTPEASIKSNPVLNKDALSLKDVPWGPVKTGVIFNAMIAPLIPFKIKGFLWYQGESNVENAQNYDKLLVTMIASWRKLWKEDLPFYYVQIAPYKYGEGDNGVLLRNAQRLVENSPSTAMTVISDIGNINDIHPKNKKEVGIRLANIALKNIYGYNRLVVSGPKLLLYETKRNQIVLYFDSEIEKCDKNCKELFEIADNSGEFKSASVKVKSNTISLSNDKIALPIFARFGWGNILEPMLSNKTGLPASSFVTDNWLIFKGY